MCAPPKDLNTASRLLNEWLKDITNVIEEYINKQEFNKNLIEKIMNTKHHTIIRIYKNVFGELVAEKIQKDIEGIKMKFKMFIEMPNPDDAIELLKIVKNYSNKLK